MISHHVYILLCNDNSYYVGHTNDLKQRLQYHNTAQGAHHTKTHRPVKLLYSEPYKTQKAAMARERQIKRWSRAKKEALIQGDLDRLRQLSKSRDQSDLSRPAGSAAPSPPAI